MHPSVIRPQHRLEVYVTQGMTFLGRFWTFDLYMDSFDGEIRVQGGPAAYQHTVMKLDEVLALRYLTEDHECHLEALKRARAIGLVDPKPPVNMAEVWENDARGDTLTDDELDAAIEQLSTALPYLDDRGPEYRLTAADSRHTMQKLVGFRCERQRKANGLGA